MKRNRFFYFLCFLCFTLNIHSQNIDWEINTHRFADNREYKCSVQIPQSIMGQRIAPEIGLNWEQHHHIRIGANVLNEFGSDRLIDQVDYISYYAYKKEPFSFYFGNFDREKVYHDFPRAFFYDSLNYYRPNVQGLLWKYEKNKNNLSVFLDWTSRQTDINRETFFMGGSGTYYFHSVFSKFYYYMYHRAG